MKVKKQYRTDTNIKETKNKKTTPKMKVSIKVSIRAVIFNWELLSIIICIVIQVIEVLNI